MRPGLGAGPTIVTAAPSVERAVSAISEPEPPLLEVRALRRDFHRQGSVVSAIDGVDLAVYAGDSLGIIGESGSGKSTLARCITRLDRPTAGTVHFQGRDVTGSSDRALLWFRRQVQPVFQDALTALNPRWTVRRLLFEPLRIYHEADQDARVAVVLDDVGVRREWLNRRPHDLSGGERQRVAIARALVLRPSVLVLDEPTASVDMSMRRSLLALLVRLQAEHGLTYLYISHDIRTVKQTCSRTVVMYRGRLVEEGSTRDVLTTPAHVYTRVLVSAVPRPAALGSARRSDRLRPRTDGPRPSSTVGESACVFLARCPCSLPECGTHVPKVDLGRGHVARCVLAGRLPPDGDGTGHSAPWGGPDNVGPAIELVEEGR